MATGRYHQFGVTDPTSNFFKLDYQMLAQPILKADQEYKQLDDAYNQFSQQLATKEVLPEDVPDLNERVKKLQDQEKAIRDSSNGDILDPRYQEGLRGLINGEVKDDFYKGAAWNLNLYKQSAQYRKEYAMKYGEAPDAWQDPTGSFFDKYQGFKKSGFAQDMPIDPRFPYHEKAVEYATPAIQKKIQSGEWREKTVSENGIPHKMLVYENQAAVPKEEIKRIIKLSTIGDGSKPWSQLKTIYENTPDLQAKYPSFDDYYNNGVLESVGSALGYKWIDKSQIQNVGGYGGDGTGSSARSTKLSNQLKEEKINLKINKGPSDMVQGTYNPLSYPDHKIAMKAKSYYDSKAGDILNGFFYRNDAGERVQSPDLETSAYDALGIPKDNSKGIKLDVSSKAGTDELGVFVNYVSKDGVSRTVDLLSGEALLRKGEMPDELQANLPTAIMQLHQKASDFTAYKHQSNEIDRFNNMAAAAAFGDKGAKKLQQEGFYGLLSNEQKDKVLLNNRPYSLGIGINDLIQRGQSVTVQSLYSSLGITNFVSDIVAPITITKTLKDISAMYGIPVEQWNQKGGNTNQNIDAFIAALNTRRKEGGLGKDDVPDLNKSIRDFASAEVLSQSGDPRIKKFTQIWKDQWTKGVNENMEPLTNEESESGLKAGKKRLYYYNQTNTTGEASSGKFWTGGKELLLAQMGYKVGGDMDQRATFSNMELFNYNTNTPIKADRYQSLADPKNWDLVGIVPDDEGFNLIIKDNTNTKKGEDSWIEVRNKDMAIDYMVQAKMGHKLVFDTADQMLKQFGNQDQNPVKGEIDQPYGTSRTSGAISLTTQVDMGQGIFTRPIERLEHSFRDPDSGKKYDTGTFRYYSLKDKKYIYTADPLDVTIAYLEDRDHMLNENGASYQSFSKDTFGGKINIQKNILERGDNTLHTNVITLLNEGILSDPLLPGNLTMTDATRDKQRAAQYGNPASLHTVGKAVDLVPTNGINDASIEFFSGKAKELGEYAEIFLEFPPNDPRAKKYAQTYGSFVKENPGATGAHFHIEYKK